MAKDTPQNRPSKETDKEAKGKDIDPRAHRRLLRFINAAQKPEDLMVAPHDRKFVDEEEAHSDHIEHHQEERQILDRELAKQILAARDEITRSKPPMRWPQSEKFRRQCARGFELSSDSITRVPFRLPG